MAERAILRVLVVEDEPDLREATVSFLRLEGLVAHGVGNAQEADAWLGQHPVDVIVLDVGLPDRDGIAWLRHTASMRPTGVVITSARGELGDRLRGHDAGADAYLVKPFELEELVAIVHNLGRKLDRLQPAPRARWRLDVVGWELTAPNGPTVRLTRSEAVLMHALARQRGMVVPREELVKALGHNPDLYDPRRMEALVRRLRNKVRDEADVPMPLETSYGVGYAFVADIEIIQGTK